MAPVELFDPTDPRLDPFRNLPQRGAEGEPHVVAESELAVTRWLRSRHPVLGVLTTPERWPRLEADLPSGTAAYLAPIAVIREVVGFPLRRGAVAWGPRPLPSTAPPGLRHRVVLAEGLSDPRNLGALIRNARAFGVEEVVVTPGSADPFSRRAIRAAAGLGFQLDLRLEPLERAHERLAGWSWLATTPQGETRLAELEPGPRWVLVVGNEGQGLSPAAQALCETRLRIPLAPGVDSLNVAAATAVCLHALCPRPDSPG
ncbi:MAG: RNA methyltransferase [Planctomycetota bacterium]